MIMNEGFYEYFDFIVTDIRHVIFREPSFSWNFIDIAHHNHYVLALVLTGECLYKFKDIAYKVKKGDLIFFQKNLLHTVESDSKTPWSFISTTFDVEPRGGNSVNILNEFDNIMVAQDFLQLSALFCELNYSWSIKRPYYLLKCRSIITEILYVVLNQNSLLNNSPQHSQKIKKIFDFIVENNSVNYSVKELAIKTDLSYSHFSFIFKQMSGYGVTEYQNLVKINKAKDLLLSGERNVTEVAHLVGFDNIYYFSRLFKKVTGLSPSDYLKR